MNKRWIATHLLPILLAVIVVSGGVVYAVPSWRQKASQIASKTVGILADVINQPQQQPTGVSVCGSANVKFGNFIGPDVVGPLISSAPFSGIPVSDTDDKFWLFSHSYGKGAIPLYPTWRTAKDIPAFGDFVGSWQAQMYSNATLPAGVKDTPPFNRSELAPDQPVIAARQAVINPISKSAKIAVALDIRDQVPKASGNLKNSDLSGVSPSYYGTPYHPNVNMKVKVTGLEDDKVKLLDRRDKELNKDSDGNYIYQRFHTPDIERDTGEFFNYQAIQYSFSDFADAYRPFPIVFQLVSETTGIATITATLEDPTIKDSCKQITTEPLIIPVVNPEAKIDPKEVETEAIIVANQDQHKLGWFDISLLGRPNEKDTIPLANRKVKLSFQKDDDSNPFIHYSPHDVATLTTTRWVPNEHYSVEQTTDANWSAMQTTDANGQIPKFALTTTPGIVKVTIQDEDSGYEKSWPLTIAELPTPEIGFCANYAEETIEYDSNTDQGQTTSSLPLAFRGKEWLAKLKSLLSPVSAKAQPAVIDYQKTGMSCSIEKQIIPGDKDEYKFPFTISAGSTDSSALPLKNLILYVEIGDIETQESAPKIYDITGVKLIDHGEFEVDIDYGPNGKLVYKLDAKIEELKPGQRVSKEIVLQVPRGIKAEDVPVKATLQTAEGKTVGQLTKIENKEKLAKSPAAASRYIPLAKAQDNSVKKPLQKTVTEKFPVVTPPTPKVELIDLQRKNDKEKYVSVPKDRIKTKKDNKGNTISYEGTEVYPGDRLIVKEYIQNNSKQAIKKSKLVLLGADDNPKDLKIIPQKMAFFGGSTIEGQVTPNGNVLWEIPEMPAGAVLQAEISITLPDKLKNESVSLKFTPQFKVVGDKKTQNGPALELDLWDWLEGTVTGPYGHPVPDAYITLVDKDSKDIEHIYYEEELTKTAKDKLKEEGKNTLDFTLTDEDGSYKLKINKRKDIIDANFKLKLYLQDHRYATKAKLYAGRTPTWDSGATAKIIYLESQQIPINSVNMSKMDVFIPRTGRGIWAEPDVVKNISYDEKYTGRKGITSELDIAKGSAEVYYNTWQAKKITLGLLDEKDFLLKIHIGDFEYSTAKGSNILAMSIPATIVSSQPVRTPYVEWHELGHLFDHRLGMNRAGTFNWDNCDWHGGYANNCTIAGLIEGFATFYADMIADLSNRDEEYGSFFLPFCSQILPVFDFLRYDSRGHLLKETIIDSSAEEFALENLLWYLIAPHNKLIPNRVDWITEWRTGVNLNGKLSYSQLLEFVKEKRFKTVYEFYQQLKQNFTEINFDSLFIVFGIFYDQNRNWSYDNGEEIGKAANSSIFKTQKGYMVSSRPWRSTPSQIPGSFIKLSFYDQGNKLVEWRKTHVSFKFDFPYEFNNYEKVFYPLAGEKSYFRFLSGLMHSTATIIAEGDPNPLVIDSDDYWQMINSGMFDHIAEHDFYVDGGRPVGISSEVQPPTGDPNGPAANQQSSFDNLPENEKPVSINEQPAGEVEGPVTEPQTTLDKVVDTIITDSVFEAVTGVVSTIIDDVNLVIDTITGQTEPKKEELNINELIPQLTICKVPYDKVTHLESQPASYKTEDCSKNIDHLSQGDLLKVDYSITNTFEQTLAGLNLTLQLNYSKPDLYNLDPKNGFKTDSFDQITQQGRTTINWPIDELKPQEVLSKEVETEITQDDYDDLNLTALISAGDLKRLGETRSIQISKRPAASEEQPTAELQDQVVTESPVEEQNSLPGTAQDQGGILETLRPVLEQVQTYYEEAKLLPQEVGESLVNYYQSVLDVLNNLFQSFQEQPQSRTNFQFSIFNFQIPAALAADTQVVAGPTISLSSQTPSPVKAPTTLVVDCKGFDKSKKITIYLDNKEYKSSPIISKNFGIKVEIPANAMLGAHTIKIVGDNDQQAGLKFKVSQNNWWNKKTVGMGLSVLIVLVVVIVAVVIIKRRKKYETKS